MMTSGRLPMLAGRMRGPSAVGLKATAPVASAQHGFGQAAVLAPQDVDGPLGVLERFERFATHLDGDPHRTERRGGSERVPVGVVDERHVAPGLDGVGSLRLVAISNDEELGSAALISAAPERAEVVRGLEADHADREVTNGAAAAAAVLFFCRAMAEELHVDSGRHALGIKTCRFAQRCPARKLRVVHTRSETLEVSAVSPQGLKHVATSPPGVHRQQSAISLERATLVAISNAPR